MVKVEFIMALKDSLNRKRDQLKTKNFGYVATVYNANSYSKAIGHLKSCQNVVNSLRQTARSATALPPKTGIAAKTQEDIAPDAEIKDSILSKIDEKSATAFTKANDYIVNRLNDIDAVLSAKQTIGDDTVSITVSQFNSFTTALFTIISSLSNIMHQMKYMNTSNAIEKSLNHVLADRIISPVKQKSTELLKNLIASKGYNKTS